MAPGGRRVSSGEGQQLRGEIIGADEGERLQRREGRAGLLVAGLRRVDQRVRHRLAALY